VSLALSGERSHLKRAKDPRGGPAAESAERAEIIARDARLAANEEEQKSGNRWRVPYRPARGTRGTGGAVERPRIVDQFPAERFVETEKSLKEQEGKLRERAESIESQKRSLDD